ncbi:sirohydrochlorin chelatase [Streptomyces lycii]|uniref:Sirohydrochlorin chelatase n=1 Tax=Streptomyces lycii TaxID=2654337 RepID=A0ABQ7FNF6_9ACTN|nr:sirohydrochlorin chelatase [Streptomyces lycii]KAF4409940.1 sirohydrochlorin chelatase [Streptomyces lycii]
MTASHTLPNPVPLGSTAQLMSQITGRLTAGLAGAGTRAARGRAARRPALIAVAHGSRDPGALRTVTALLDRVRALRPDLSVRLGHIELNEPLLTDTLADPALRSTGAVLVPLLLSRGHHVKHDIPRMLAAAPGLDARFAAPLGPHPLLVEALHGRLQEAGRRPGTEPGPRPSLPYDGVVLAAAGSRYPDAAVDTGCSARMLSERLGGVPVVAGYASAAAPTVPEALRALRARGCRRIAVASYFTAPGRFASDSAAAAPGAAAAPLGDHPALARLVLGRYAEALATPETLRPAV